MLFSPALILTAIVVIYLFHPLLGLIAALGSAILLALAYLTKFLPFAFMSCVSSIA